MEFWENQDLLFDPFKDFTYSNMISRATKLDIIGNVQRFHGAYNRWMITILSLSLSRSLPLTPLFRDCTCMVRFPDVTRIVSNSPRTVMNPGLISTHLCELWRCHCHGCLDFSMSASCSARMAKGWGCDLQCSWINGNGYVMGIYPQNMALYGTEPPF